MTTRMANPYLFDNTEQVEALSSDIAGEGELPVDIAETSDLLIIMAPIAGVDPEKISIHLDGDVLTIRGTREREIERSAEHFFSEECFWGNFSRSIILPVDVKTEEASAQFKNGMLTLTIPKQIKVHHIPIVVVDED
jgi:HSP20 family protein